MSYLPPLPNFTQSTQGQGYGNWQQYAGYSDTSKNNPYGNSGRMGFNPNMGASPAGAVAPVAPPKIAIPQPVDYSIAPPQSGKVNPNAFGGSNTNQMGTSDSANVSDIAAPVTDIADTIASDAVVF